VEQAIGHLAPNAPPPDLVIADFRLTGGVTGVDAILRLRRHFGHAIPGLLITGDTAPDRLHQVRRSGFPLLHKPVESSELLAAISGLIAETAPTE
jgi:CheY-like chemotaxis protein